MDSSPMGNPPRTIDRGAGKGSRRRPRSTKVTEEELSKRWDKVFGPRYKTLGPRDKALRTEHKTKHKTQYIRHDIGEKHANS